MLSIVLLVLGFVFLVKGADLLIDGASSIAKKLNISNLAIGMTVVAIGTTVPELVVGIFSSIEGNSGLAMGNVLGSNISNVLIVLGVAALIHPILLKHEIIRKEIPFAVIAAFLVAFMANDFFRSSGTQAYLNRTDGIVLLIIFGIYVYYTRSIMHLFKNDLKDGIKIYGIYKSWSFIMIGTIGLVLGGKWVVDGSLELANMLGIGETAIGLTLVAIGTSFPELATAIVASVKKRADIAIGNVVGANIITLLWVLGISAIIKPIPFHPINNIDIGLVILVMGGLFVSQYLRRDHQIKRVHGVFFILTYIAYSIQVLLR